LPTDLNRCAICAASIQTASFAESSLQVEDARAKAREFLREYPAGGYMTIVEHWRQLPDEQIQFTVRRLPTSD
jgi:hypothetical protein